MSDTVVKMRIDQATHDSIVNAAGENDRSVQDQYRHTIKQSAELNLMKNVIRTISGAKKSFCPDFSNEQQIELWNFITNYKHVIPCVCPTLQEYCRLIVKQFKEVSNEN